MMRATPPRCTCCWRQWPLPPRWTPAQAQFGGLGNIVKHVKTAKKVSDSMREIGPDEEIKIGGDLAGMILGAAPLVDNSAEQHYVNRRRHVAGDAHRPRRLAVAFRHHRYRATSTPSPHPAATC